MGRGPGQGPGRGLPCLPSKGHLCAHCLPRVTPRPRWVGGAQSLSLWAQAGRVGAGRGVPTLEHIGMGWRVKNWGAERPGRRNEKGAPGGVIFQQNTPPAL